MLICLSSRQNLKYRQKADILRVEYRDKKALENILEDNIDKIIIYQCLFENIQEDLAQIMVCNELYPNRLIVEVMFTNDVILLKEKNIRCFINRPIMSYYELNGLIALGVDYVILGAPLFFEMDKIKEKNIPVIIIPNIAYGDGIPRPNGINGTWIRPEDLQLYEQYAEIVMFDNADDIKKEQGLYRIYWEEKTWPGELDMLITNFNLKDPLNRLLSSDFTKKRLNCGQKCEREQRCKICYRLMDLADPEKIKQYRDFLNTN